MSKRLLSYDPVTGIKTYHDYDHSSKSMIIHTEQDVNEILKLNKEKRNDKSYKQQMLKGDNHYHYATVPCSVLLEWREKYNLDYNNPDDMPKIERLLDSIEYQKLRTVNKI